MSDADVAVGEEPAYEEKIDEKPRSILLAMMKQLKTGMDLSRVTLPTFILEPRSFLEKCSDFMAHGSIIASCAPSLQLVDRICAGCCASLRATTEEEYVFRRLGTTDDALDRFLLVTKWYLSGWHFKPPVCPAHVSPQCPPRGSSCGADKCVSRLLTPRARLPGRQKAIQSDHGRGFPLQVGLRRQGKHIVYCRAGAGQAPCNEARKAAQLRMRGLCSVGWASCRRAKPLRTKCQSVRRCRTTRQCLRSTR